MTLKEDEPKNREALKQAIEQALSKIRGTNENDLCKYLPGLEEEGYMHHFTLKKLKNNNPEKLFSLLRQCIIDADNPRMLEPKPRAARSSHKQRNYAHQFSRADIERVLTLARQIGDEDLIARFSPKRPLQTIKRELIHSIKNDQIRQDLWNAYSEAIALFVPAELDSDDVEV